MRPLSDEEAWIVEHNLPLVASCLRGRRYDPATYDDLLAAGYLALCQAIRCYDPAVGKWGPYAWEWITRMILRELANLTHDKRRVSLESREAAEALTCWQRVEHDAPENESCKNVDAILEGLTERRRAAVVRLAIHEDRLVDVAADLGATPTNTLVTQRKALLALRRKLETCSSIQGSDNA